MSASWWDSFWSGFFCQWNWFWTDYHWAAVFAFVVVIMGLYALWERYQA